MLMFRLLADWRQTRLLLLAHPEPLPVFIRCKHHVRLQQVLCLRHSCGRTFNLWLHLQRLSFGCVFSLRRILRKVALFGCLLLLRDRLGRSHSDLRVTDPNLLNDFFDYCLFHFILFGFLVALLVVGQIAIPRHHLI